MTYEFLMDNLNLYYLPDLCDNGNSVFLLWYYFAFAEPAGVPRFVNAQTRKSSALSLLCLACSIWRFAVQHAVSPAHDAEQSR